MISNQRLSFQHKLFCCCKSDQLRIVSCISGCHTGRCTLYIPVSCVHLWSSTKYLYIYNAAKSNVLYFPQKGPNYADNLSWHLAEGCVKSCKSYNHLEIPLNLKLDPGERSSNACRKSRQAYFALKTSEQLNPIPVSKLYKRVVRPSVLYGCGSYGVIIVQRRYEL